MQGAGTWEQPFKSRARSGCFHDGRRPMINDGDCASEPLGSDERGEEIDEHGGRHQDCHYGYCNAFFK
jgi:hypothetical protein